MHIKILLVTLLGSASCDTVRTWKKSSEQLENQSMIIFKNQTDDSYKESNQISIRDVLLSNKILLVNKQTDFVDSLPWPKDFEFPLAVRQVAYVTTEAITYDAQINMVRQNANVKNFDDEDLQQISTIVDDTSFTQKQLFETQKHMTMDPFNNRVKIFNKDFTFRVPQKMGYIYEFGNQRSLIYDAFKKVCQEIPLEDQVGAGFFESMQTIWNEQKGKTQYLGTVKVNFNKESKNKYISDELHMFVNQYQYLEPEMNFQKSTVGARTIYLMKQSGDGWRPYFIAQLDSSMSNFETDIKYIVTVDYEGETVLLRDAQGNPDLFEETQYDQFSDLISYAKIPHNQQQIFAYDSSETSFTEQQKSQVDKEFYDKSCHALYDDEYRSRALSALDKYKLTKSDETFYRPLFMLSSFGIKS